MAVILLVLGGVCPGVVAQDGHEPSLQFQKGKLDEGVGGHVEPHALEEDAGGVPVEGGAAGHLGGYFFVGGELEIKGALLPGNGEKR